MKKPMLFLILCLSLFIVSCENEPKMPILRISDGRSSFFQWDLNQTLIVNNANNCDKVHFTNSSRDMALVAEIKTDENGIRYVNVPNSLLTVPLDIEAYLYSSGEQCQLTVCKYVFKVIERAKPENYVYAEDEHKDFDQLLSEMENNLTEMEKNLELTKQYRDEAKATNVGTLTDDVNELKGDLVNLCALDVTWNEDCYVKSGNGEIIPYEENPTTKLWASNPIPVKKGMILVTQYFGSHNIIGYSFYDKNGRQISGYGGNDGFGEIRKIVVPENATTFRFTKDSKDYGYFDYNLYYSVDVNSVQNILDTVKKAVVEMRDDILPQGLTDFNDFPSGTIYKILSIKSVSDISNAPIYPYKGLVITLNATREVENVKLQIATTNTNRIFMRSMWTTWGDWVEVTDYSNNEPVEYGNLLAMYDNITCIGDSLTYGQVYTRRTPTSESRQAKRPYPKVLAELCGAEYEILANSGDTSQQAWNRWNSSIVDKVNNINIVYLGTNGGLTDTITTDCPSDGAIDDYADTNTGCYGKILKKIYDLGQKAILIKIYDTSGDLTVTNSVIEQFGEMFNFPVVDAIELGPLYRMCPLNHSEYGGVHYNDIGYSVFANILINKINALSETMLERLIPTE